MISAHTCPLAELGGWETGGMNVYVRELGRELATNGHTVDIFTRRQACDSPDVVEYVPGARVVHVDAGPHRAIDKYDVLDYLPEFACGVQRWRALTGMSYDVIHSHYWLSGRLATLFRDRWDVPMVTMFHTLAQMKNRVAQSEAEREQRVRFEIERHTMACADMIVAATEVDRSQIRRYYEPPAPLTVIPGGVDLARFQPGSRARARSEIGVSESKVILFVGRIQRLKGLDVAVRAFHEVIQAEPALDARLVVVGGLPVGTKGRSTHEGREIARVQKMATRLGLSERLTWVGAVQQDQLPFYYQAANVTVMPSSYESFGLVAVESLASGTPVIATRVGGLTTIVRDGETGYLVPWRDPSMFAERIREVLANPVLRHRLSVNARASVERFGWGRIAAQHMRVYEQAIADRQPDLARHGSLSS